MGRGTGSTETAKLSRLRRHHRASATPKDVFIGGVPVVAQAVMTGIERGPYSPQVKQIARDLYAAA